jgi:hypothetical protein
MIRLGIAAAALMFAAASAWADPACRYGSWGEEARHATAEGWRYIELTPAERNLIIHRYEQSAHERITASRAYEERLWQPDASIAYSIVFADDEGCIQFRLNFPGSAELAKILDPGI